MNYRHKELAAGRWFELTFFQQMANVGSEVERAINWRDKKKEYGLNAVERALELLALTIDDEKNRARLRELTRLYEVLVDYFYFDNLYGSSEKSWQNYFHAFNYAVRVNGY